MIVQQSVSSSAFDFFCATSFPLSFPYFENEIGISLKFGNPTFQVPVRTNELSNPK